MIIISNENLHDNDFTYSCLLSYHQDGNKSVLYEV